MGKVFRWVVIGFFTVVTMVPLLWLLTSSFKTNTELFASPFALPSHWSFDNYAEALRQRPILTFLRNSAAVAAIATALVLVAALMASYSLLHRFRWNRPVFAFLMFGILVPINALMTPVFFIVNILGLYNSVLGVGLAYAGLFFPMGFLIIKTYMDTTPPEILEAARIDGAGYHRVFGSIVVPLCAPGAATAGIFLAITAWNELLFASILTEDSRAQTVQVGVRYFLSTYSANYPLSFAATVIAIAPTVVLYALLSDRVVAAMTAGSLK